jgi:hypothetical protein
MPGCASGNQWLKKYTLETKGLLENNQVSGKNAGDSAEGSMQPDGDRQAPKKIDTKYMFSKKLECSPIGASGGSGDQLEAEKENQETRWRVEFKVPISANRSLMNFMPYQKNGSENGGLVRFRLRWVSGMVFKMHNTSNCNMRISLGCNLEVRQSTILWADKKIF